MGSLTEPERSVRPKALFWRVHEGLRKSRRRLAGGLRSLFVGRGGFSTDLEEGLEALLIQADLGVEASLQVLEGVRAGMGRNEVSPEEAVSLVKAGILSILVRPCDRRLGAADSPPTVILAVGANGTGKTTSLAKLAARLRLSGAGVVLAACDTFRAAAVEQIGIWAERLGVELIAQGKGADAASVAYDALHSALSRGVDYLLVDTAGRLHTRTNLMEELRKIRRTLVKLCPSAPHETLLVLDATTGQNGLIQARRFKEAVDISGVVLAKLDGTAKGGIVVAVERELGIPVKFVGLGEGREDLQPFDPALFVEALFS